MVRQSPRYKTVQLNRLEDTLAELKSKMGESDEAHASFTTQNMIVVGAPAPEETIEDDVVKQLMRLNPARFFLLELRSGDDDLKLTARCEVISKEDKICSEVIRIESSQNHISQAASALRSHLLTGVATDMFIVDVTPVTEQVGTQIMALCERVIFDGRICGGLGKASWLGKFCQTRIDLEWLRLAPWRESVRLLFEIPGVMNRLSDLKNITFVGGPTEGTALASLYMAGWILCCLKLEVVALGIGYYECRNEEGKTLEIRFEPSEDDFDSLRFQFKSDDSKFQNDITVTISKKGEIIETVASGALEVRLSQPYRDFSTIELLQRFFLVGTSVYKYDVALRLAIDIENLKQGFRFS